MQPPTDVASISTFYDQLGRADPKRSLMKVKDGHLVDETGETALAILLSPRKLMQSVIKDGLKLVQLTDRSGNPVWVNPEFVTKVRAGARATIIEQDDVDLAPWDPIQVRESLKVAKEQLRQAAAQPLEVALVD